MRASNSGGAVTVLAVIPPEEIQHGFGVAEVMRAEAYERIEAHFEVFAKWMRMRPKVEPELIIREGDPAEQLLAYLNEDPEVASELPHTKKKTKAEKEHKKKKKDKKKKK